MQAARALPPLFFLAFASESFVYVPSPIDKVLGYRIAVVEVPQHRAVTPDPELEAVTIAEDVILVFGLDCLEPAVRKAEN